MQMQIALPKHQEARTGHPSDTRHAISRPHFKHRSIAIGFFVRGSGFYLCFFCVATEDNIDGNFNAASVFPHISAQYTAGII